MTDAIKPTSVEGYLIRVYDQVEHLDKRMVGIEHRLEDLVANERMLKEECDARLKEVESRMIKGESQTMGAKEVKSSVAPYLIAFVSCVMTILSYVLLHLVGIK